MKIKIDKELAKKIYEMHKAGLTYNQIAVELNVHPQTVYRTIKKIEERGLEYFERKPHSNYFRTAKSLIKKLPKWLVKKIFEEVEKIRNEKAG